MEKTWHPCVRVGAMVLAIALTNGARSVHAEGAPSPRLIVNIQDYAALNHRELTSVERETGRLFERIGVDIEWRHTWTRLTEPFTAGEVSVVILSPGMSEQKRRTDGLGPGVLGTGLQRTGRAYVFYQDIVDLAASRGMEPIDLVARVLAHELGHLVAKLPHAEVGLMRKELKLESAGFHLFTPADAASIRSALLKAMQTPEPRFALRGHQPGPQQ